MSDENEISGKPLLQALAGRPADRIPVWLMRQAGRYLPEYREIRARVGDFLELCFTPELAAEVTLQPVRRFGMDGAILFSDILVVPHALGQSLAYVDGEGPKLGPIRNSQAVSSLSGDRIDQVLAPVYQTVRRVRADLPPSSALIGFAGAPWTVACYMVEGGGSKDFAEVKRFAYGDPDAFGELIEILVQSSITYLRGQVDAGVEAVQLFDSWAGILSERAFDRWVIDPTAKIVKALRQSHPTTPIIGFPRGAGRMYERYLGRTGVDALGLDTTVPLQNARSLQSSVPVQGNLDPVALMVGGDALRTAARDILVGLGDGPFVFNLGHGVLQHTPPDNVATLVGMIRDWPGDR